MTWEDNAYFAPEALVDGKGRQIMWAWIFDDRPEDIKNAGGWSGTYGLPRSLWLGDDGTLRMRPVEELKTLRLNERERENIAVRNGEFVNLDGFGGELVELEILIQPLDAKQCGVTVCCSARRTRADANLLRRRGSKTENRYNAIEPHVWAKNRRRRAV